MKNFIKKYLKFTKISVKKCPRLYVYCSEKLQIKALLVYFLLIYFSLILNFEANINAAGFI